MCKKLFIVTGIVLFMTVLISPAVVFGADVSVEYVNKINQIADDIKKVASGLIVLSAIFIAIMYMSSAINPKWKDYAKSALYSLILGVFILALYKDITRWVTNFALMKNNNQYTSISDISKIMQQGQKSTGIPKGAKVTIAENRTVPKGEPRGGSALSYFTGTTAMASTGPKSTGTIQYKGGDVSNSIGKQMVPSSKIGYPLIKPWNHSNRGQDIIKIGSYGTVTDPKTGISFIIHRTGGTNHVDFYPATKQDEAKMKKIAGSRWMKWQAVPVVFQVFNGPKIAAAIYPAPHPMTDLYFFNSGGHANGNKVKADAQRAVVIAGGLLN